MHHYTNWEFWTEDLNKYESGVYFALHLGDRFGPEGRYQVLHKLGNGVFSQVWLGRDRRERYITTHFSREVGMLLMACV
jgi:hypothetical protein